MKARWRKYLVIIFITCCSNAAFSQGITVTGVVEATSFSGIISTAAQPNITSVGTLTGLTVTGALSAISFSGNHIGPIITAAQPNITSVGQLTNLSVLNVVSAGKMETVSITGAGGVLQLRETGGEFGEAGVFIYNKSGSNGPIFYTNPTSAAIDLVDFGFLSQATNSQTNIRFEHRAASWLDALNTNGEMQFYHITNNGAAATPNTPFAAVSSAVTIINSTNSIKLNGGTGPSTFATSGAGTLVLGGAASTGAITLGESSGTQTVNVGTGTGASTVNIATGATNGKIINIGTGAVANTINIGNNTGATDINILGGTGTSTFATTGAGTLVLGGAASTGTITLGESSGTQTVNVGTGSGASTVNIATGVTSGKTINIGTGAIDNVINIGNITGTTDVNILAGTGTSTFATTGAGTLVLGGAASTGTITLGESSGAQTVNIGTGAGVSVVNIGTGSSAPEVTIGRASTTSGAGLRLGNARFTINKPTLPTTGLNANTTATLTQIIEAGIIGFASNTARNLTMPTAQGATGLVQALPGTPAVGDVFSFVVFNTGTAAITLLVGTGVTISGPPAMIGTASGNSRTYYCRVTSVAANTETITCY